MLRIQGYRHFCNKLWNATRFAMINGLGASFTPLETLGELVAARDSLRLMDKWILSRLSETVELCEQGLRAYELATATTALFNFWLYDLCDYYIEYLKPSFYSTNTTVDANALAHSRQVLYTCLDVALRLISPFMPFISEELYQRLPRRRPGRDAPSICVTAYPAPSEWSVLRDTHIEAEMRASQEAINKIRSLRADYQLTVKSKTDVFVHCLDVQMAQAFANLADLIQIMSNSRSLTFLNNDEASASASAPVGCALTTLSDKCKLYLLLKGIIDVDKEELKMSKRRDALNKQIEAVRKEMTTANYETRVPEAVRVKNKEKVTQLSNELELIADGLKQLQLMR